MLLLLLLFMPVTKAFPFLDSENASILVVKSENEIDLVNLKQGRRCPVRRLTLYSVYINM